MGTNLFNLEKLTGRDNFATWKFSMRTYLEHEDLWECVQPSDTSKTVDAKKDMKAKAKLILLLDPQNYIHVQDCTTAKQVWENLQKAFDDNGLTRKVGLLKDLVNTSLESSNSVEDYISKIMTTAHKLRNIGFEVNEEWLGTLMLAGLPEVYMPMIMGLESSGVSISADLVKTKLLQEVKSTDSGAALYTNFKKTKQDQQPVKPKGPRCYSCNKHGHYAKFCKNSKKTTHKQQKSGDSTNFVAAFSASLGGEKNNNWFIDSGASMTMTARKELMYNISKPPVTSITVGNKASLPVLGVGCVDVKLSKGGILQLKNVLYTPGLGPNLISVSSITKNGYEVRFFEKGCHVVNEKGKIICSGTQMNKLYLLDTANTFETAQFSTARGNVDNTLLWHLRMSHLNVSDVNKLPNAAEGVTIETKSDNIRCTHCAEGKQTRLPFNKVGSRATQPLELIHSDLCGPMEHLSVSGMKYFITFVDDYTRMFHVYFLKDKLNISEVFKDFKARVELQLERKIKMIRTDGGKEYCNNHFEKYLSSNGIIHQTTTPYTAEHNGLSERGNRTLVERARCMLFYAKLEPRYWAEAIATAAYITNRSPSRSLEGKTPYEMWYGRKPNLSHIRIFGTEAMVHIPKQKRQKWDKKSTKLILVGYCENSKGYRLLDPTSRKIIKSRDVIFHEKFHNNMFDENTVSVDLQGEKNPSSVSPSTSSDKKQSPGTSDDSSKGNTEDHMSPTNPNGTPGSKGKAIKPVKDNNSEDSNSEYQTDTDDLDETYYPSINTSLLQNQDKKMTLRPRKKANENSLFCLFTNLSDPQSVEEAMSSPHAAEWKKAMDEEYNSLMKNNTWSLTDLPTNKKALPSKWVFKTKTDQAGEVTRFKARLVIKGFAQKKGIDYEEIYSPVVRYTTIRYLFALAAKYSMDIDQMDAVSAFLQGEIDTDIYMVQPELYVQGSQVCCLHKSIYGLKQASRLWNMKLNCVLQNIGMQQSKTDPCVYFNEERNTFIAVWVDDLLIFTSQQDVKDMLKKKLMKHFEMKDLGKASQCLGFNITKQVDTVMLDQKKYINEILDRFGMSECKAVKTPIEPAIKFSQDAKPDNKYPYRQVIGCLLYIAQATRPDISFAVNALSRYNAEPKTEHVTAVKRLLRYLQGTKDLRLSYTKNGESNITGYCDADWAADVVDRKSCTGYIFMLQGGAISWSSRKQQTVALSTAEAEYMAMSSATQEALWLRQLSAELGQCLNEPLIIFSDNQSAIKLSLNDCYLPRSRHIDIRYHFLKEHVCNS